MIFKDEYRQTINEIKTDDALLEKVLTQAAEKRPPLYRKRMLQSLTAAAASAIIISTGILTLPTLMDVFAPAQDKDYMSSFIEDDSTHSTSAPKDSEASPFTPPASSPPLSPAPSAAPPKNNSEKPSAAKKPASKTEPQKDADTPAAEKNQSGQKPVPTIIPDSNDSSVSLPRQTHEASAPTAVPTAVVPPVTSADNDTAPTAPPSLTNPQIPFDNGMNGVSKDESIISEDASISDMPLVSGADQAAEQKITLYINQQPPIVPGNSMGNASGGGSSGHAGAGGSGAAPSYRRETLTINDYCSYLGIDIPGKAALPAGMALSPGEPALLYSGDTLVSDGFSFLYSGAGRRVSIHTSRLGGQEVQKMLTSSAYEKSDINGIPGVVIENQEGYTVYLNWSGVFFTITAEGLTQEELSVLLSSLTG